MVPMYVPSTAPNGVAAPATTPSQVKPKKRTTILFMLYTAHTRIYIRSAIDAREKTKQVFNIIFINLQSSISASVRGI